MTQSALDAALAEAAAQANGEAHTAQPIAQVAQETVVQSEPQHTPVVANYAVAAAPVAGTALSMDSSIVQAQSGITDFFKLTDGGCQISDVKYDPIKVRLRLEDAQKGGGFKPALMMNYEAPSGMVYTKSYDGQTTVSSNPAHSALSWAANKQKILQLAPKAYDFLGYDIAFVVAEDVTSKDKKTVLKAGTVLGFTTPFTASKMLKKVWDAAINGNQRGNDVILKISGEEISKNNRQYKQLVVELLGYEAPVDLTVDDQPE